MPVPVSLHCDVFSASLWQCELTNHPLTFHLTVGTETTKITTSINCLVKDGVHFSLQKPPAPWMGPSKQRLRRVATQQERKTEALGGHRQSGSGSRVGYKGDGRVIGRYRIENKFRTAKSYRVDLAELRKIRAECQGTETPVFDIEFREKGTLEVLDNWVLIPRTTFEELNAASDDS